MYKKIIGIVVFAFSLMLSHSALADSWGCGDGIKKMVTSLKLDDSQKAKIKPILDQLKSTIKDNASQMGSLETQLHQQVVSANMDQSTVDSLVDQKTKLIGNIIKAKIMAKNQIYAILNPQQKTELQTMMKNLEDKMAAKFKSCHEDK